MITRDLQRYKWEYENGFVTLTNKVTNESFKLPMTYLDSFVRASIAFKNAFKADEVAKLTKRLENRNKAVVALKLKAIESRKNSANKRAKDLELIKTLREKVKTKKHEKIK